MTRYCWNKYYKYNGLWQFTSNSTSGHVESAEARLCEPRFGVAYRVNDKTALRFGYALYSRPTSIIFRNLLRVSGFEDMNSWSRRCLVLLVINTLRRCRMGSAGNVLESVSATNPLVPHPGKSAAAKPAAAAQTLIWYPQNLQKDYNNRLNFTVEHSCRVSSSLR